MTEISQVKKEATTRQRKMSSIRDSLKGSSILTRRSLMLDQKLENLNKTLAKMEQKTQSFGEQNGSQIESNRSTQSTETDQFQQKYEIIDKIGQGCNATVYSCKYKPTGKTYAVKKIKCQQENIHNLKKDFIFLKDLNHSSLCHYKALYIKKEMRTAFLVMEHCGYPSLENYKIKNEEQLRSLVKKILQAIRYLHEHNFCHRDIKPENILYNQVDKSIKIIDFGVSKKTFQRGQRRDMLTIIGTHFYMAPEMFSGGGYDEKIDLWALGVTIYKLVTGKTPFESEFHADTIKNIQKGCFFFDKIDWGKRSIHLKNFISSLLTKAEKRMTINESFYHVWMLQSQTKKKGLRRLSSFSISISDGFQEQLLRMSNATSKEQGHKNSEQKHLFKSLNTITNDVFRLQDSDDEQAIVASPGYTPCTAQPTLTRQEFADLEAAWDNFI